MPSILCAAYVLIFTKLFVAKEALKTYLFFTRSSTCANISSIVSLNISSLRHAQWHNSMAAISSSSPFISFYPCQDTCCLLVEHHTSKLKGQFVNIDPANQCSVYTCSKQDVWICVPPISKKSLVRLATQVQEMRVFHETKVTHTPPHIWSASFNCCNKYLWGTTFS